MRAQNCRPRTISERRIFIYSVFKHADAGPFELTKMHLVSFLGKTDNRGRQLTGRTKQNYRSCLHTFFAWMQDEDLRADNPAFKLPKVIIERKEANPTSTADIQQLLDSGIYGRTRMMVLLYAYQGLRASEIAAVSGANIDWNLYRIFTVDGKGGKEVWRPLHSMIIEHCSDFSRTDFWFPGQDGHVRGKSVSATLSAAFRRAGISHTGHNMRAWYMTEQLEAGVDSTTVQYNARHGDAQSLKHYDKPSFARLSAGQEQLPRVVVPITSGRGHRYDSGAIAA